MMQCIRIDQRTSLLLLALLLIAGCGAATSTTSTSDNGQQPGATPTAPTLLAVSATPAAVPTTTQTAQPASETEAAPTATATPLPSPPPTASPVPATSTPLPTASPAPPTATPDPYADYAQYTIEGLRSRSYGEGEIEVLRVLSETPQFTRELFAYQSDGLRITGQLTRPRGEGPFPVVVLNHGYFPLDVYRTGYDTQHASDYLAAHGYLCLAPDFRSHAGSDTAPNTFRAGHVIDTLNLLPLIEQLPDARRGPLGMWGHSNGGEITTKAMLVSDQIAAALIYAPASPNLADNYYAFGEGAVSTYPLKPQEAPELYERLSPINHLHYVNIPVQIHWGTADVPVPREWVLLLHEGLLAAGKDSTLFIYEGGGHSLQGADQELYLQRTLAFFDQHVR